MSGQNSSFTILFWVKLEIVKLKHWLALNSKYDWIRTKSYRDYKLLIIRNFNYNMTFLSRCPLTTYGSLSATTFQTQGKAHKYQKRKMVELH